MFPLNLFPGFSPTPREPPPHASFPPTLSALHLNFDDLSILKCARTPHYCSLSRLPAAEACKIMALHTGRSLLRGSRQLWNCQEKEALLPIFICDEGSKKSQGSFYRVWVWKTTRIVLKTFLGDALAVGGLIHSSSLCFWFLPLCLLVGLLVSVCLSVSFCLSLAPPCPLIHYWFASLE